MLYILFCNFLSFCEGRKTVVPEAGKILLPSGRRTGRKIFPVHTCPPSEEAGSQDRSHSLPDGNCLHGSRKIHPTGWFPALFHIHQHSTKEQSATVPNISYNLKSRLPFPGSSPVSFSFFCTPLYTGHAVHLQTRRRHRQIRRRICQIPLYRDRLPEAPSQTTSWQSFPLHRSA